MTKQLQKGFTLIELMIVVAIIGILAAVAIPQYQNYVVKSRLANALSAVDSLKTAVAVCVQEQGGSPDGCNEGANGIPTFSPTNEVSDASVEDGVIEITLQTGLGFEESSGTAGTITYTPNLGETSVTWAIATDGLKTAVADIATKNSASGS